MDQFAIVLNELGELIGVPLVPDHARSCGLIINGALHLQIKEEDVQDRLLISTFFGELPPGRFQEIVLKELLKENGASPRIGTFCYSRRNNQLGFFTYATLSRLNGDLLSDVLELFLGRAFSWKAALETGQMPKRLF